MRTCHVTTATSRIARNIVDLLGTGSRGSRWDVLLLVWSWARKRGSTTTSLTGLIGREYLRVSAKGNRSIREQHDDNGNAADREGLTLGAPYEDRGSASRYATSPRDDDLLARSVERLERKVEQGESRLAELSGPGAPAAFFPPGGNVLTRWLRTPIAVRREVAAYLFTADRLGLVRVTRSSAPGKPGAASERLVFRRRAA
ncbi:hypothetical protein [Streptomyces sp. NPDC056069]|uniref:hypothetical protein n=1 Tax=Streptomyces sp. NPDC056069 TaxID=3345702 RepID=UPI0035E10283